jgi:hypothetical protein
MNELNTFENEGLNIEYYEAEVGLIRSFGLAACWLLLL